MGDEQSRHKKWSRRAFLKAGVAAMAGLAGSSLIPELNKSRVVIDKERIRHLETQTGEYYPIPDFHESGYIESELQNLPRLDVVQFEYGVEQKFLVQSSIETVLARVSGANMQTMSNRAFVPPEEIDYFAGERTRIAFEGQLPKSGLVFEALLIEMGEALGSMSYMFKRLLDIQKARKGDVREKFDSIDVAITGWGLSPLLSFMASGISSSGENSLQIDALDRVSRRLVALSSHTHPENTVDFFRTLNFARQQLLINKYLREKNPFRMTVPKLGYKMGLGHGNAIEDFIRLGEEFIYPVLSKYPREFWKNMTDINGGVDMLSTTPLFEPKLGGITWERELIKDERFESILRSKTGIR